jgi:hypothetical protein
MSRIYDRDPTLVPKPVSQPEVASSREVTVHLVNLAKRFGVDAVQGAAADLPEFVQLSEPEQEERVQAVIRDKFVAIIERGGEINHLARNYIQEDLGVSNDLINGVLGAMSDEGLIEYVLGTYRKKRTPEEALAEEMMSAEEQATAQQDRRFTEYASTRERIIEVFGGREGLTVAELVIDIRRLYPETNPSLVPRVIGDTLRNRFRLGSGDRLYSVERKEEEQDGVS